jgi:hypothetical protein
VSRQPPGRWGGVRVSPPPPTGLLLAAVREEGRLVDPSELLDGAAHSVLLMTTTPRPQESHGRRTELLGRKPHYAKRIGGDVGQGARPGPTDPNEELWSIIQPRTR